ncbi:MAG: zf-HC2 domain-containing protein [Acidiferrobacterales bacterium]|nr:zf-HC2 domain-containing protein [Acidiferrobacterales bacterium]
MKNKNSAIDPTEMTCQEMESFIDDYLDNKLSDLQRDTFDAHIDYCPDCFNFMVNYRNAIRLGKTAYADDYKDSCEKMPDNLVEAIMQASKK